MNSRHPPGPLGSTYNGSDETKGKHTKSTQRTQDPPFPLPMPSHSSLDSRNPCSQTPNLTSQTNAPGLISPAAFSPQASKQARLATPLETRLSLTAKPAHEKNKGGRTHQLFPFSSDGEKVLRERSEGEKVTEIL